MNNFFILFLDTNSLGPCGVTISIIFSPIIGQPILPWRIKFVIYGLYPITKIPTIPDNNKVLNILYNNKEGYAYGKLIGKNNKEEKVFGEVDIN